MTKRVAIVFVIALGFSLLIPASFAKGRKAAPEVYSAIEGEPEFYVKKMEGPSPIPQSVEIEKKRSQQVTRAKTPRVSRRSRQPKLAEYQKRIEQLESKILELQGALAARTSGNFEFDPSADPDNSCDLEVKWQYDPVPSDKKTQVAERLRLIERLLVRYNRAYDYRAHTKRELVFILHQLDEGSDSAVQ